MHPSITKTLIARSRGLMLCREPSTRVSPENRHRNKRSKPANKCRGQPRTSSRKKQMATRGHRPLKHESWQGLTFNCRHSEGHSSKWEETRPAEHDIRPRTDFDGKHGIQRLKTPFSSTTAAESITSRTAIAGTWMTMVAKSYFCSMRELTTQ